MDFDLFSLQPNFIPDIELVSLTPLFDVVTNCDVWTVFSFPLLLFIVCTITVSHVTDDLYFRT
jgi:hypothetical protein